VQQFYQQQIKQERDSIIPLTSTEQNNSISLEVLQIKMLESELSPAKRKIDIIFSGCL
jgi:hypothetical protein